MTDQTELREAIDYMKEQEGSGSKQRKQDRFEEVYTTNVGHIVTGERYDDAGVGPATAEKAAEEAFGEVPDGPTLSERISSMDVGGDIESLDVLVRHLDLIAEESGNDQTERLTEALEAHTEPSLVTLALLDDESLGLGTSQMREIWFDGSRDERKRAEALVETTTEFIDTARNDNLPTEPEVFLPFDPMLAERESRMPDNIDGWVAQLKLDGYRILIHVEDNEARAYTRNRKDVTHSLPELNEIGWPEGSYILDGEVIAETGSYADTSSRVGTKPENIDPSIEMEFALFDVVYANRDMTQETYRKRHGKLQQIDAATPDPRVYLLDTSTDIGGVKQYAREHDYEGVILKDPEAEYELGKRSTGWVKEKNTEASVDVVAVEFIEGEGESYGTLGKIRLESADGVPVGKTGSGFTDAMCDEIWANRDEYRGECLEVTGEAFDEGIRFPIFQRWRVDDGEPDTVDEIREQLPKA